MQHRAFRGEWQVRRRSSSRTFLLCRIGHSHFAATAAPPVLSLLVPLSPDPDPSTPPARMSSLRRHTGRWFSRSSARTCVARPRRAPPASDHPPLCSLPPLRTVFHKRSFAPIGPGTVPVETVKVIRPNHVSDLSRINVLQCRKRCTGQQKGSPFSPFRIV
jgi:hypothetical protein